MSMGLGIGGWVRKGSQGRQRLGYQSINRSEHGRLERSEGLRRANMGV